MGLTANSVRQAAGAENQELMFANLGIKYRPRQTVGPVGRRWCYGWDVLRIARNARRKRRQAFPVWQPNHLTACGEVWPQNRIVYPSARIPAATTFWPKRQKVAKALFFPGAKRKTLSAFFDGAESIAGEYISPHATGGRRRVSTLTSAAVHTSGVGRLAGADRP